MIYEIGGGDGFKKFKEFINHALNSNYSQVTMIEKSYKTKNLRGEGVDGLISHLDWSPHHS